MLELYKKNKKNNPLTKLSNLHERLLREGFRFIHNDNVHHIRVTNGDIPWLESKIRTWDSNSNNITKVMTSENVKIFMSEKDAVSLFNDAINYASLTYEAKWSARAIIEGQLRNGATQVSVYEIFNNELNKLLG